jgi:tetratricopeptide (TPR) repeat protein
LTTFISLFLLIVIGKYAYAETIKIDGIHYSNALKNIEKRIALSSSNIDYRFQKIDALELAYKDSNDQAYVQELLQEALKIAELDKNNPISLIKIAQYFAKYGYGANALESSSKAIEKAPWLLVAYEQYISYGTQYSIALLRENKLQETTELLKNVQDCLSTFEKNLTYRDKMIPEKYRYQYPYNYSDVIRQYGGSALVMLGEYDRAKTYLEPLMNNKDAKKKINAALWLSILEEKIGNIELAAQLTNQGTELDTEFEQKRAEILQLMQKLPIQE